MISENVSGNTVTGHNMTGMIRILLEWAISSFLNTCFEAIESGETIRINLFSLHHSTWK